MRYRQLIRAIESASQELAGRVASVANQALVIRNWMVGAYLVEFEQRGEDRAKYGARLLERIATDLEAKDLKGFSETNLKQCRQFYWVYPQIGQTASGFFAVLGAKPIRRSAAGELPAGPVKSASPKIRQTVSDESADIVSQIHQTLSGGLAVALPAIRQTASDESDLLPSVSIQGS